MITGGSGGIGAALARRLAADGWRCVLLARDPERLETVSRRLGAEAEPCDVGDRAGVEKVAFRIAQRHPAIHLLVNNAGIPAGGGFLEVAPERIEEVTQTNYLGSVWCLRAFLPLLRRGAPSDVVNVASVAGAVVGPTSGPYSASKHAQLAFSRSVAAELAGTGVRVHAVNPGPVPTPGFPQGRAQAGRFSRYLVVQADDVARAIVKALEHDRRELFIPSLFRLAAAAQGIAPGSLSRLAARHRWGR